MAVALAVAMAGAAPGPSAALMGSGGGGSVDRDGTMTIDWQEWRDHFLLHPLHDMEAVVHYWKHSMVSPHLPHLGEEWEPRLLDSLAGGCWRQGERGTGCQDSRVWLLPLRKAEGGSRREGPGAQTPEFRSQGWGSCGCIQLWGGARRKVRAGLWPDTVTLKELGEAGGGRKVTLLSQAAVVRGGGIPFPPSRIPITLHLHVPGLWPGVREGFPSTSPCPGAGPIRDWRCHLRSSSKREGG